MELCKRDLLRSRLCPSAELVWVCGEGLGASRPLQPRMEGRRRCQRWALLTASILAACGGVLLLSVACMSSRRGECL